MARRLRASCPAVVVGLIVWLLFSAPPVATGALTVPLCGEVHGFAGEYNDFLRIPITKPLGNQEAIVLVARTFPPTLGSLTQGWLQVRAEYTLSAGVSVVLTSDDNGVLVIADVARGSDVEVHVNSLRKDGPVPFVFFSMHANAPSCYVSVTAGNPFYAPLPPRIRVTDEDNHPLTRSATFFFTTVIPEGFDAAAITVEATPGGLHNFYALSEDGSTWKEHLSGDRVVGALGGPVLFSYTPNADDSAAVALARISAEPAVLRSDSPTTAPTAPTRPDGSLPSGSVVPSATPESHPPSQRSRIASLAKTLFIMAVVTCVAYMIGCTYYNIRVRGIHEFPEMIPFIDSFRACWRAMQLCFARLTGQSLSRRTGEYNSLDEQDFYR